MRLDSFAGVWRLSREIEDLRENQAGRFAGDAIFEPAGEGLAYAETGLLTFPDAAPMQASRRFLWRAGDGGGIEVRFDDGRYFHRFALASLRPEATHHCGDDRYHVRYEFGDWPEWRCTWEVTGPRKTYRLVSAYRPAGQDGGIAR